MIRSIHGALGAIVLLAAIFAAYMASPLLVQAPAVSETGGFDTQRALARLERILGDERPHPVDSEANDAVRARLIAEIEALGFSPMVRDDFFCRKQWAPETRCARLRNIAFWVSEPGENAVMVSAHYDSVPAGPGAADDGSGVAAALEIAGLVRDEPGRPMLVLITDGEETGLLGAGSFVETDPLAQSVKAVVNMEARGVTGSATLFQTSVPNGRDIAWLGGADVLPAASSANVGIFTLLPNDTDMTYLLPLGPDVNNLAFIDGLPFYHTPQDNLARLDPRSVAHMGASALAAVRSFRAQAGTEPESEQVYADLLKSTAIAMPLLWARLLLGLGAVSAILLVAAWRRGLVRSLIAPPLAIVSAIALPVGMLFLMQALRAEPEFANAHPWALRAVYISAALGAVSLVFWLLVPRGAGPLEEERGSQAKGRGVAAGGWLWFAVLGIAASVFVPGLTLLFALPMIALIPAAIFAMAGLGRPAALLFAVGAALFALVGLPLGASLETAMSTPLSVPALIVPVMLALFCLPFVMPASGRAVIVVVSGLALIASFVAAFLVPAYSPDAPYHLSFYHFADEETGEREWLVRGDGPLPDGLAAAADFAPDRDGSAFVAPAPDFDGGVPAVSILSDEIEGEARRISLVLETPGVDLLYFELSSGEAFRQLSINGEVLPDDETWRGASCNGRSCGRLEIEMALDAGIEAPVLDVYASLYGLGPEGAALIAARPDWALPVHTGDRRRRKTPVPLEPASSDNP